ncbi:MAG: multidrug effflux MFS transporter [Brucellaceae bacterium]|jgi:DHA1 family florfenicol/chloramphenicol resistance protein-like MFS transporter|nr:multidrug effflux MFS transporter [Brucellaceae bacterium]
MFSLKNKSVQPAEGNLPVQWNFTLGAALFLMAPFDLLASMGMDIYLPVIPHMSEALQTSPPMVQLTLSLYLGLLGTGQLIFGPLSDRAGRRPVLLGGAFCFTLASAGLAMTGSAPVFLALRLLQSAGAAAMLVATFATVRDVYAERPEGAVIYSLFSSMLAFVPALAPLIGALLDIQFGWRSIFWALAILGAFAGLHAALRWPETRIPDPVQQRGKLRAILTNGDFWTYTTGFSTAMGTFFVYFSTAPRLLIDQLGLSTITFSLCFASIALVMVFFARFAGFYTRWWGLRGTLRRGLLLIMAGGMLLLFFGWVMQLSVVTFIFSMWIVAAGIALTSSVTANGALKAFGAYAGMATAIYYCIESLVVSIAGTLAVLLFGGDTVLPLSVFCIASALLTLGLSLRLKD